MLRRLPTLASRLPAATALALLLVASPSTARAYEDELTLGVAAGYAWSAAEAAVPRHGLTATVTAGLGLDDVFALQALVGAAWHPAEPSLEVVLGGLELVYLVDVLEVVPFFGLGVDAFGSFVSGEGSAELGLHALLGFDWLVDWEWALGVDVRVFYLPLSDPGRRLEPLYGTVLVRATRRFSL